MANKVNAEQRLLLERHRLHQGIYARIARKLNVDASYVSRVASGDRKSDKIDCAMIAELERIEASLKFRKGRRQTAP
jgi:transcriptional regulator with XRE-family HTH domain